MKREFLFLACIRFIKLSLNVVTIVLYGRFFGVGFEMDSWILASSIVAAAGMAMWGAVNETVRSRYVHEKADRGEHEANRSAASLMIFTTVASVIACLVLYGSASTIVGFFSTTNDYGTSALAVSIFVLMLPSGILVQLLNLATSYMNCYGVVYLPEFMGIAGAVVNILCTILLVPSLGVYAVVCGYYIGLLVSIVIVFKFLLEKKFFSQFVFSKKIYKDGLAAVYFALPLFLAYAVGQGNMLFEKYLAGLMGVGVISSVNYASQIKSTLQAVLSSVVFSVIVPRLTLASTGEAGRFRKILEDSQRVAFCFVLIVIPLVFGASEGVASIILGRNGWESGSLESVSNLIRLYVLALLPLTIYVLYAGALLSQQKGKEYGFVGAAAQTLSIFICAFLYDGLGANVFPIALFSSHLIAAVFMIYQVDIDGRTMILREASSLSVGIGLVAGCVLWIYSELAVVEKSPVIRVGVTGISYILFLLMAFYVFSKWRKRARPE